MNQISVGSTVYSRHFKGPATVLEIEDNGKWGISCLVKIQSTDKEDDYITDDLFLSPEEVLWVK